MADQADSRAPRKRPHHRKLIDVHFYFIFKINYSKLELHGGTVISVRVKL